MSSAQYRLVIGNKAWSSWSLRPWLVMKRFGLPFEEINIRLREPDSRDRILEHSPAGKVPALLAGDLLIWDSLAIIEELAARHPDVPIWPGAGGAARANARSISAEMHSGFQALRENCPMDLFARKPLETVPEPVDLNIRRIVSIWRDARGRFGKGGPFLFGWFSAADAMYAPVASRFRTYISDLADFGDDGTARDYVDAVFAMPEMDEWAAGAREQSGE
jgi:glutathione S-transferase